MFHNINKCMIYTKVITTEEFDQYPGNYMIEKLKNFLEDFKKDTQEFTHIYVTPDVASALVVLGEVNSSVALDKTIDYDDNYVGLSLSGKQIYLWDK